MGEEKFFCPKKLFFSFFLFPLQTLLLPAFTGGGRGRRKGDFGLGKHSFSSPLLHQATPNMGAPKVWRHRRPLASEFGDWTPLPTNPFLPFSPLRPPRRELCLPTTTETTDEGEKEGKGGGRQCKNWRERRQRGGKRKINLYFSPFESLEEPLYPSFSHKIEDYGKVKRKANCQGTGFTGLVCRCRDMGVKKMYEDILPRQMHDLRRNFFYNYLSTLPLILLKLELSLPRNKNGKGAT